MNIKVKHSSLIAKMSNTNRKYFGRMTLNLIRVFLQGTGYINTYFFLINSNFYFFFIYAYAVK